MEDGIEGARFQMIVYAPSESGLSDTKIPDLILQSGRTPLLPSYALLLFNAPEELTLRTLYELDATKRTPRKTPGVTAAARFPVVWIP